MRQTVLFLGLLFVSTNPLANAFAPARRLSPGSSSFLQHPSSTFKKPSTAFVTLPASRLPLSDALETSSYSPQNNTDMGTFVMPAASNSELLAVELQKTSQMVNQQALLVNGGVVGTLALVAAYQLFHVHLGALWALWDYGLGPVDQHEHITLLNVAMDLLLRLPQDLIQTYEELVPTNPIFFKACTSGVAYGLGDFISQLYQGKKLEELDLPRTFRSGAAGFIAHGPLCHFWLLFMETYLDFDGAWWATGIKVTADLTVWSIFLNAAYSTIIGLLAFRSPVEVLKDVRATQWPALRSAWRFWPFVHTVSFSHAVPLDLKLLWVDVMEVVWVTILSKVNNEDKAAQEVVMAEAEEGDVSATAVLAAVDSQDQEQDLLAFPKTALAACWPLIVMWPVLYFGYQAEHALGLVQ